MKKTAAYIGAALLVVALLASCKKEEAAQTAQPIASFASFTNSIGMVFVKVPAGSFTMGTMASISADETPARTVTISNDFWIGQFEVTQAQWHAVMGNNPADFKSDEVGEDSRNFPVESVSWNDVQDFIKKLNAKDGKKYRLPTEAEWEYACRSGGKDQKYCGGNNPDALAWYGDNSGNRTHRVGTKQPNGLGIYDMSGNVWEWVSDWYGENYYGQGINIDPAGPARGESRVFRGGSWNDAADSARAAFRGNRSPGTSDYIIGVRLVSP